MTDNDYTEIERRIYQLPKSIITTGVLLDCARRQDDSADRLMRELPREEVHQTGATNV